MRGGACVAAAVRRRGACGGCDGRRRVVRWRVPDTPVLMADGTTKTIREIQAGDNVTSTDPQTGQTGPRRVSATHINIDDDLVDVTVKTEYGGSTTLIGQPGPARLQCVTKYS